MLSRFRIIGLLLLGPVNGSAAELSGLLKSWSAEHGFALFGDALTAQHDVDLPGEGTPLARQLRHVLEGYAYILETRRDGSVVRLAIMGENGAKPVPSGRIELAMSGPKGDKRIQASLRGPGGTVQLPMLVDTGASLVVLPKSLAEPLGLSLAGARSIKLRTANGDIEGQRLNLPAIKLGNTAVEKVDIAMVESETITDFGLLGMSLLSRYQIEFVGEDLLRLTPQP